MVTLCDGRFVFKSYTKCVVIELRKDGELSIPWVIENRILLGHVFVEKLNAHFSYNDDCFPTWKDEANN